LAFIYPLSHPAPPRSCHFGLMLSRILTQVPIQDHSFLPLHGFFFPDSRWLGLTSKERRSPLRIPHSTQFFPLFPLTSLPIPSLSFIVNEIYGLHAYRDFPPLFSDYRFFPPFFSPPLFISLQTVLTASPLYLVALGDVQSNFVWPFFYAPPGFFFNPFDCIRPTCIERSSLLTV